MRSVLVALVALSACSHPSPPPPTVAPPAVAPPAAPAATRTLTIIGTNDLHGALERLPLLAGFVDDVRAARAADGGGVLLLDAGDLFQGTLESNTAEGADVVRAYNAMGYAASAIGNHEFDFGPVGPDVTAKAGEDPRGALKARIAEAKFPFLVSDIVDAATGQRVDWPNAPASTMVEVAGVKVGIVGASTEATPTTTMPANLVGLRMAPVAASIEREANALRAKGAAVVVVVAHLGSECHDVKHPDDVASCDHATELFDVLGALPPGLVDVVVAGHTHAAVANRIDGVAVIESLSSGRAFGRVDVHLAGTRVAGIDIFPPEVMCPLDRDHNPVPVADCHPAPYEGRPVVADPAVQRIVDDARARTAAVRDEQLGVTLAANLTKAYKTESAEGDLLTDLMLVAHPDAQVAMSNGGGWRADIPAGALTYGELFQAMPFDNRFALIDLRGDQLRRLVRDNLEHDRSIFSWAGLHATARCTDDKLKLDITIGGKPLDDKAHYRLVTSDFLASGGDGALGKLHLAPTSIHATDVIIRDALAGVLRKRKGTIDPAALPHRLDYPGKRPLRCGKRRAHQEDGE